MSVVTLSGGDERSAVGLGTWDLDSDAVNGVVRVAFGGDYTHVDNRRGLPQRGRHRRRAGRLRP